MRCIERFVKYREDDLDRVLIHIRNGTLKPGKYAHLVKVDESIKVKEGKLFKDEK